MTEQVVLDAGAFERMVWHEPSRPACWVCGLREDATIHGSDMFWQHEFEPAILTKAH